MKTIFLLLQLLVFALAAGTLLNSVISPEFQPYMNLLSLSFPFFSALYVVLSFFWLIFKPRLGLILILLGLILIQPVRRWINYSEKKTAGHFKMVSFNGKNGSFGEKNIKNYLIRQDADVVIWQEFHTSDLKGYHVSTESGVAIASKYPILKHEPLRVGGENSISQYADISINGQTIRFFSIYLEPFYFDKKMVKPGSSSAENEGKLRNIVRKLTFTFKVHAGQVDLLKKHIQDSPYPVVVAGDFNAVPNSYEYFTISKGLKDSFLEAGRGSGTSFHDYKFPIKIDHIFTSESIEAQTYRVDRTATISDHFPVISTFNISK